MSGRCQCCGSTGSSTPHVAGRQADLSSPLRKRNVFAFPAGGGEPRAGPVLSLSSHRAVFFLFTLALVILYRNPSTVLQAALDLVG